jgi:hypothetical protein
MILLYADLFWGPGPDSQGTRRSTPGAGAGAGRAGLGTLAARGGTGSAQLSATGRFCICCGRPAHVGRDAAKAPRAGGGARQRPRFYTLLSCGQVSGGPQPRLPRHSSPHRPPWRGICPVACAEPAVCSLPPMADRLCSCVGVRRGHAHGKSACFWALLLPRTGVRLFRPGVALRATWLLGRSDGDMGRLRSDRQL